MSDTLDDFIALWQTAFDEQKFVSLTLADQFKKGRSKLPHKQMVRPVLIKEEVVLQWELPGKKKQTHLNLSIEKSIERLRDQFGTVYREAYLFTAEEDVAARASKKGVHIKRKPATQKSMSTAPQPHDRVKKYLIPDGIPCAFLSALGVMNKEGKVKKQKLKKFRQINRYLEIVNDVYSQLPESGTIRVVDFGCGLSYLTFALHHLLTEIHNRKVDMVGIDRNTDVIDRCTQLAKTLDLTDVRFEAGEISVDDEPLPVHLAISLHACDTATDHALAYAVRANADVVLAVPCCQHELHEQLNCGALAPLTQFGILKERFAAEATDTLRASALKAKDYQTQILEFIDLEHTPKNLLIRAVRKADSGTTDADYQTFKQYLGAGTLASDLILSAVPTTRALPVEVEEPEPTPVEVLVAESPQAEIPAIEEVASEKVTSEEVIEVVAETPPVFEVETQVQAEEAVDSESKVEPESAINETLAKDAEEVPEEIAAVEQEVVEAAKESIVPVQQELPLEKEPPMKKESPWGNR